MIATFNNEEGLQRLIFRIKMRKSQKFIEIIQNMFLSRKTALLKLSQNNAYNTLLNNLTLTFNSIAGFLP
jgi:hypothetical protein